jgi:hypothetical protein
MQLVNSRLVCSSSCTSSGPATLDTAAPSVGSPPGACCPTARALQQHPQADSYQQQKSRGQPPHRELLLPPKGKRRQLNCKKRSKINESAPGLSIFISSAVDNKMLQAVTHHQRCLWHMQASLQSTFLPSAVQCSAVPAKCSASQVQCQQTSLRRC